MLRVKARKSLGEYKAILVQTNERGGNTTTVLEMSPERFDAHTKHGVVQGNKFARGNTHQTREDAIEAGKAVLQWRIDTIREHIAQIEGRGAPQWQLDKLIPPRLAEISSYEDAIANS
jgi:hypothetical protein